MSREDDDDDWSLDDYVMAAIAGPLSGLPIFGAILETGLRAIVNGLGGDVSIFSNSSNPLDKAADGIIKNRFINALQSDEEAAVSELIQDALADTRAWSQILGTFNKSAAIVPVALRVIKDAYGVIDNILPDTHTETDAEIIADLEGEAKDLKSTKKKEMDDLLEELSKLSPEARETRLDQMNQSQARPIRSKLKKEQLTKNERALNRLSTKVRAEAISALLKHRSPNQRLILIERLEAVGVLTPSVRNSLTTDFDDE